MANILNRKPPLTSTAPVIEVTLAPTLAHATEARGATEVRGDETQRQKAKCRHTDHKRLLNTFCEGETVSHKKIKLWKMTIKM